MVKLLRRLAAPALVTALIAVASGTNTVFADARDISVGGVYITTIKQPSQGYSPEQRATEITKRITEILSAPEFRQGAVVAVNQNGPDALVSVGKILVFTVTPADATGSGTTLYVAKRWAALLSEGLSK